MPIPFSFRQLEYFIAVAEHGSVTEAAQRCNVSQPSVSAAVAELERLLGRKLFHRKTGHGLVITAAGRQLLIDARTTLAAAGAIGANRNAAEEITVACFRDLGAIYLPRLLTRFAATREGLGFRILDADLADIRGLILDGRCELGLTYDTGLDRHELKTTSIDRLSPHVLLPRSHRLSDRSSVALHDLKQDRVILENYPSTISFFLPFLAKLGKSERDCQLAPSFEMQRSLVANGWGIGFSYAHPAPDIAHDGSELVCRPLSPPEPALDVVFVHLGTQTLSRPAQEFLEFVQAHPA
ncbi:MAG: LysR family transcriptional regulator [Roseovarius sp.]|uniref:LysR family transcriptional regulator n=1 Tax=Roseovarius sp. TaxID=1486281 RepID=UPI0032EFE667